MSILFVLLPAAAGAVLIVYLIRKIREYQWGWIRNNSSLKDKIYIITGANTGLGYETTKALIKRQATVILACRNAEKCKEAIDLIRKESTEGTMIPVDLDLSSFDSIKHFANIIKTTYPNFDCLINNAGLALEKLQSTKENFEMHFGVNHLGHFLLVELLKENIETNKSRIVVVASMVHRRGQINFETLGKPIDVPRVLGKNPFYDNSKLANMYYARELYKKGYNVHVLCPGLCNTDFFRAYNPKWWHYVLFSPIVLLFLRSPKQGAQNIVYAATDNVNTEEKNPSKGYFIQSLKQSKSKFNFNDQDSERLWAESVKMCAIAK